MLLLTNFIKENWVIIAIIIAIAVYVQVRLGNAEDVLKLTISSYDTQINQIQNVYKKDLELRDQAINEYKEKVKDLEENYNKKSIALEQEKKKKVQIIVKYYDDPQKLVSKIKETYGFEFVK